MKRAPSFLQLYRELAKSGIVFLVLISVLGGYLIGHPFELPLNWVRLALTLLGVLFLASGSSALNQLQEINIDAKMPRTAKRPLPSGRMSVPHAAVFIALTLTLGLILLTYLGKALLGLGILAIIFYNGFYTIWWKKKWAYAAIPGAIPGALPILMGYASASGNVFTPAGIYLFLILFYWQMPHFWVLALRFKEDYSLGKVPTLPVVFGDQITRQQIVLWCLGYVGLAFLGPLFLKVGFLYLGVAIFVCAMILFELRGYSLKPDSKHWLRFFLWVNFSLIFFIFAAAGDLWSVYLVAPLTR